MWVNNEFKITVFFLIKNISFYIGIYKKKPISTYLYYTNGFCVEKRKIFLAKLKIKEFPSNPQICCYLIITEMAKKNHPFHSWDYFLMFFTENSVSTYTLKKITYTYVYLEIKVLRLDRFVQTDYTYLTQKKIVYCTKKKAHKKLNKEQSIIRNLFTKAKNG